MPQYGMVVYLPAPADPMALSPEHLALLDELSRAGQGIRGKVLGGSYFPKQRGFAFDPSTAAMAVQGDTVREGTLIESVSRRRRLLRGRGTQHRCSGGDRQAPSRRARRRVEVRPMFVPAGQVQDDYAD